MSATTHTAVETTPDALMSTLTEEMIAQVTKDSVAEGQATTTNQDQVEGLVVIEAIDPEVVSELREMFEAAVTSPVFMSKLTGVVDLKSALKIRPSDDSGFNMCYTKAEDKLIIDASMFAYRTKTLIVLPTVAEIMSLATRNHKKNKDTKETKAKKCTPSGTPIA